jgi:hypothetical protein
LYKLNGDGGLADATTANDDQLVGAGYVVTHRFPDLKTSETRFYFIMLRFQFQMNGFLLKSPFLGFPVDQSRILPDSSSSKNLEKSLSKTLSSFNEQLCTIYLSL